MVSGLVYFGTTMLCGRRVAGTRPEDLESALLSTGCVTLGMSLHLSGPQFQYLWNGNKNTSLTGFPSRCSERVDVKAYKWKCPI